MNIFEFNQWYKNNSARMSDILFSRKYTPKQDYAIALADSIRYDMLCAVSPGNTPSRYIDRINLMLSEISPLINEGVLL